ncbi:MAG: hypothetical protein E7105_12470 [Prevotella sp.]|nr:hypothetical protein [Prevotella sp.]
MSKTKIKVTAEVNGNIYKSEVDRNVKCDEAELIASCKRHIRTMLAEDGLSDVCLEFKIGD